MIFVAQKTVATFARILGRELRLKDSKRPYTDGYSVGAPFNSPFFYSMVEHELAHILFGSSGILKKKFVSKLVDQLATTEMEKEDLFSIVNQIVSVLDDYRVDGLWATIYPGSADRIQQLRISLLEKEKKTDVVCTFMLSVCLECPYESTFEGLRPSIERAKTTVFGKDFDSVLFATKQLVTDVLKYLEAEVEHDVAPINTLLDGHNPFSKAMEHAVDDVWIPKPAPKQEVAEAPKTANRISKLRKEKEIDEFLSESEKRTAAKVEMLRRAVSGPVKEDIGAVGSINIEYIDGVPDKDLSTVVGVGQEQKQASQLKVMFTRVLGRKKTRLDDTGDAIDMDAYIQRRITNRNDPCFVDEAPSKGFSAIILIDRSYSMYGKKTASAERACRILKEALGFPQVTLDVWGFFQTKAETASIFRFDRNDIVLRQSKPIRQATTPIHTAIGTAAEALRKQVSGVKTIFLVTDGSPSVVPPTGQRAPSTTQLCAEVATEVRNAKRSGIDVQTVLIGREVVAYQNRMVWDVTESQLLTMFGSHKNWSMVDPDHVSQALIRLVSSAFVRYLKK